MASPVLQTITEKHLQCRICAKRCRQPKALGCMHSFCLQCLTTCYPNACVISCPLCLKVTTLPLGGVPNLEDNLHIKRLLRDASFPHPKDAHSVKTQLLEDEMRCEKHKKGIRRIYCVPCERLICRQCTVVDHPESQGHHYIDSRPAARERKESIKSVFTANKRYIEACQSSLQESSEVMEIFEEKAAKALRKIQDNASGLIMKVKHEERLMISQIKTLERHRMSAFRVHREAVTELMQEKHFSLEVAEDVVNDYPDSAFLELYPEMAAVSRQSVPRIDRSLAGLSLAQRDCTRDINLGTLGGEEEWEPHRSLLDEEGAIGVRAIAALPGGEIAIAFLYSGDVAVFNTEGQEIRTISVGSTPYSFAALHSQLVVADATDLVKVFNKDGTLAFDFPTVSDRELMGEMKMDLQSVAVKQNDIIVVGDVARNVLTEHNPVDGSLLRTIRVQTAPFFLAVDSIYDRYVISGGIKYLVDVVDRDGCTLFTIKPTLGRNFATFCRGVCCDSTGLFLVISGEFDGGHVHWYDLVGRFRSCIEDHLQCPYGIAFTSDGKELAVTYHQSVQMYRKM